MLNRGDVKVLRMNLLIISLFVFQGTATFQREDRDHMARCMPAVRAFVSEGGDSILRLLAEAFDDVDVVLLYLLRMCYFHHDRDTVNGYDVEKLFKDSQRKVSSFTDYEFTLLTEAIKEEQVSGANLYQQVIDWNALPEPNSNVTGLLLAVAFACTASLFVVSNFRKVKRA